ncbi:unnamed protein product [Cuscuta campestris]|uniref:Uncharacterized protein n=1 Tax=Cuscuta campestris TaxID=132261 RepID=A0A484M8X3_9ASTE|nr:unnamed protein product [Cuscuta campestris]
MQLKIEIICSMNLDLLEKCEMILAVGSDINEMKQMIGNGRTNALEDSREEATADCDSCVCSCLLSCMEGKEQEDQTTWGGFN